MEAERQAVKRIKYKATEPLAEILNPWNFPVATKLFPDSSVEVVLPPTFSFLFL
jgi:hypothetical protein